jgi:hypothetical protein
LPSTNNAAQLLASLADPRDSLLAYGHVVDQKKQTAVRYDPHRITHKLQATVLSYFADPPMTQYGQTRWLTLLGYRQGGKSLTAELCAYAKTAFTPGWDHVCIADTKDRAKYLHSRVHYCHARWPEQIRAPTIPNRESRQLTFEASVGGKMRVLSGDAGAVGIGQSPDSFHGSELPYWLDASTQFSLVYPSMINRDRSLLLLEATPSPMDAPSAIWWHDECRNARLGGGRKLYAFFPFWDGKLNVRPWPEGSPLDNDEIRLLEKYGPRGLTKENLAFRRLMMEVDSEIMKNPDLFRVYYPFDDITCWLASSTAVIHPSLLKRHQESMLVDWAGPYLEYEEPEPEAIYVMGVDPAGYAARDHAAFQVLKLYDGEWTQVACYAGHTDPLTFSKKVHVVARRYNNAMVAVESNGVGVAVLALLQELECKNIFYEKAYKPGITATSKSVDQMLSWLQEALKDELTLHDADTVSQLTSYKHDKRVEQNASSEILHGKGAGRKRRERHHWDKISALQMAIFAARRSPSRRRAAEQSDSGRENVVLFRDMTWDQVQAYRKQDPKPGPSRRRRSRYRRKR